MTEQFSAPAEGSTGTQAVAAATATRSAALPWILSGAAALALVGGGVAFATASQGGSDAAAPVSSPSATIAPEPTPSPEETAAPEPEPTPVAAALPATCPELYSPAFYAKLASYGATLSEANTGPRQRPFESIDVPEIVEAAIANGPRVECLWGFDGEFSIGMETVLADVTDEEVARIAEALPAAGFAAIPELGSVRYVKELEYPAGFSIIARDGVLVATRWVDWPEPGYTADIVNTVLGP